MAAHLLTQISCSVADTEMIAVTLARVLKPGDCIALHGDMGAGKTQFVRGLVKAYQGDAWLVSSPTYVLLHIYPTRVLTLYHLDAYRVSASDDFEGIGFAELLEQGGVVVVEWASRVSDVLPERRFEVTIVATGPETRSISIVTPDPL